MKRQFHLGDILSVVTPKLVSPGHIGGVYDILNFMTNSSLWTHQLPAARKLCRPHLLRQYPRLEAVDASKVTSENWRAWLKEQVANYGEFLEVEQNPPDDQERTNPFRNLPENIPVIVISLEKDT